MRLGEMNWMEVETYLKKDDRIMLVMVPRNNMVI